MKRRYQVWYAVAFEIDVEVEDPDEEVDEDYILERVEPLLPHHKVVYCELDQIESMGELLHGG
jgi:hypothetical protein